MISRDSCLVWLSWVRVGPKSGYDQFPLVAHGGGTKHPILDKASPLMAEEEGSSI
jgi:hypothetical protein